MVDSIFWGGKDVKVDSIFWGGKDVKVDSIFWGRKDVKVDSIFWGGKDVKVDSIFWGGKDVKVDGWPEFRRQNYWSIKFSINFSVIDFFIFLLQSILKSSVDINQMIKLTKR